MPKFVALLTAGGYFLHRHLRAIPDVVVPSRREKIRKEKLMRENLTEKQVDRMVESSFPASDPPSTY